MNRVLESALTGYARLKPQESLLLDDGGAVIITFQNGIPMTAYHNGTDTLDAFAGTRPVGVELHATDPEMLAPIHMAAAIVVPPALPAERLATDPDLVDRETAPDSRLQTVAHDEDNETDAVASLLKDETRIAELRARAREEAREQTKQ